MRVTTAGQSTATVGRVMETAPPTLTARQGVEWVWRYRDAVLAAALVLLTTFTLRGEFYGLLPKTLLLVSPAAPFLLVWRRAATIPVAVIVTLVFELSVLANMASIGVFLTAAIALYTVGAGYRPRLTLPLGAVLLLALPLGAKTLDWVSGSEFYSPYGVTFTYNDSYSWTMTGIGRATAERLLAPSPVPVADFPLALALAVGLLVRQSRVTQERTVREQALVQTGRAETERRVLLEERAGIARDLHDSVAHHVSLMVIQAEAGPDLVRGGEVEVLRAFGVIGDAGRRALAELDRTLAALREDAGALLAPQPTLDDLPALVEGTGGLEVALEWVGERRPLDQAVELAAYRIVQESLTNIVRHAGTDRASVRVDYQPDGLSLAIIDRGAGFDPLADPGGRVSGHGLTGMRERARVQGGTLAIASAPGAGTAISAYLPTP